MTTSVARSSMSLGGSSKIGLAMVSGCVVRKGLSTG